MMPNKDGTGPLGQGAGTGRGNCGLGQRKFTNSARKRQLRRNAGGNGGSGWGRGLSQNNSSQNQ